jgi:signal transduction histidine kinase
MVSGLMTWWRDRQSPSLLRRKHTRVIASLVCGSLVLLGATEMYFSYQEARQLVGRSQSAEAAELAGMIRSALGLVERQLAAVTTLPWKGPGWLGLQDRREEYMRLLRLAPMVDSVSQVDAEGVTVLTVSRRDLDAHGGKPELSDTASPVAGPASTYSAVQYAQDYDPYVSLVLVSAERGSGRTVARINLRALAAEVAPALLAGPAQTYAVDASGKLVLHRDPSAMLARQELGRLPHVQQALSGDVSGIAGRNAAGRDVIASSTKLLTTGWVVIAEQPRDTALKPVFDTLYRTGAFLLGGLALSVLAAYHLAGRLTQPILTLHRGAERVARGDYATPIQVRTGDELEALGTQFDRMALSVHESHAALSRKVAERTYDLEIANRHKSEFLANMSHELRTPLNAVISMSQALAEQEMFGPLTLKQAEYAREINGAGRDLLALINDVLDLSKIEAGRLELDRSQFHVADTIDHALRLVRERAEQRRLELMVIVHPEVGDWVADERRVGQILLNLLSNAVKFTPPGGRVTMKAEVLGGRDGSGARLMLSVSDTGIGIPPEHLETIFEPFRQLPPGSANAEGTGLGLPLVRRFVELHGGEVQTRSVVGQGTTITVNLPRGDTWPQGDAGPEGAA